MEQTALVSSGAAAATTPSCTPSAGSTHASSACMRHPCRSRSIMSVSDAAPSSACSAETRTDAGNGGSSGGSSSGGGGASASTAALPLPLPPLPAAALPEAAVSSGSSGAVSSGGGGAARRAGKHRQHSRTAHLHRGRQWAQTVLRCSSAQAMLVTCTRRRQPGNGRYQRACCGSGGSRTQATQEPCSAAVVLCEGRETSKTEIRNAPARVGTSPHGRPQPLHDHPAARWRSPGGAALCGLKLAQPLASARRLTWVQLTRAKAEMKASPLRWAPHVENAWTSTTEQTPRIDTYLHGVYKVAVQGCDKSSQWCQQW